MRFVPRMRGGFKKWKLLNGNLPVLFHANTACRFAQSGRRAFAEHAQIIASETAQLRKSKFNGNVGDPCPQWICLFEGRMNGTQSLPAQESHRSSPDRIMKCAMQRAA